MWPMIYRNILFVLHLESCTFKEKPPILFSLFTFYNILQLIDIHNWGYYNNAFWWTQAAAVLTVNVDRYILTCISYYPDTINFFQLGGDKPFHRLQLTQYKRFYEIVCPPRLHYFIACASMIASVCIKCLVIVSSCLKTGGKTWMTQRKPYNWEGFS